MGKTNNETNFHRNRQFPWDEKYETNYWSVAFAYEIKDAVRIILSRAYKEIEEIIMHNVHWQKQNKYVHVFNLKWKILNKYII